MTALIFASLLIFLTACKSSGPVMLELTIRADDLHYVPNDITLPRDQPIRILLQNDGILAHDIVVENLDVKVQQRSGAWVDDRIFIRAEPGERIFLVVQTSNPGTFDLVCSLPGHMEAGMRGTLTVE